MYRYFIYLSFDGRAYHGWQIQPNGITVEEALEKALSTLLHTPIDVTGAGRTDAGVNARLMVAHFDLQEPLELPLDCHQLAYRLNKMLPRDISVSQILPVPSDLHARFSAKRRTYHYYIHTRKDPFRRAYSHEIHYALDFDQMNAAAQMLVGTRDFQCFCKAGSDVKTTVCDLYEARWDHLDGEAWCFTISANRFRGGHPGGGGSRTPLAAKAGGGARKGHQERRGREHASPRAISVGCGVWRAGTAGKWCFG